MIGNSIIVRESPLLYSKSFRLRQRSLRPDFKASLTIRKKFVDEDVSVVSGIRSAHQDAKILCQSVANNTSTRKKHAILCYSVPSLLSVQHPSLSISIIY